MATEPSRLWRRVLMPLIAFGLLFQLSACGDNDAEQRKAFTDFLQNTAMRSGENLPSLSEDQKQKFGHYVSDYAILYGFSQQFNHVVESGIKPVTDELSAIHSAQDYLTHRDTLRQASEGLSVLAQQLQTAHSQADSSKAGLKQPEELKTVYDNIYNQVVTQPANATAVLLPGLQALSQSAVQTGDFLQQQGTRVTFNGAAVQFPTQDQVTQYNNLMNSLRDNAAVLSQAQRAIQDKSQ